MPSSRPAFALAEALVDQVAADSPCLATFMGVSGHDDRWDDFSPAGVEARAATWRRALAELGALPPTDDVWEQLARDVIGDHATGELDVVESGDHLLDLNSLVSPFQLPRLVLDSMPVDSADDRERVRRRLLALPEALEGYRALLAEGLAQQRVVGRRQVEAVLEQGAGLGGADATFGRLAARCAEAEPDRAASFHEAAAESTRAYAELCRWLSTDYMPHAGPDPVGRERYTRAARRHLGMDLDVEDAYAWGWAEVGRLEREMAALAGSILPGTTTREALDHLQTDPQFRDPTAAAFLARMRSCQERALSALDGVHFVIPAGARELRVERAPAGGPPGAYYVQPGEGFSRPGTVWYSLESDTDIPWFDEVSTAFHEGFPGHHLQIATVVAQSANLSRFQRTVGGNTGYAEGWALYSETLMGELGFLESPAERMGMYVGQLARAWRVVVDTGLHLELQIPDNTGFHGGSWWTPALAVEAMHRRAGLSANTAQSEVNRYLGWPGQAITYKLGQRVMLDLRAAWLRRPGADLRSFHERVLSVGSVGLERLRAWVG